MQFHEIILLFLPLQGTLKLLRLLADATHQWEQLAFDKLKRMIAFNIPHFFLLIIGDLMSNIIEFR
jgi:hypothetical protein